MVMEPSYFFKESFFMGEQSLNIYYFAGWWYIVVRVQI